MAVVTNQKIKQFENGLAEKQRAERKYLVTIAQWTQLDEKGDEETVVEFLGTRTPDSSIEYNADIQTSTDIRGNNYTDIESTQPQQDFDPYLVLGKSKLGAFLNNIRSRNAISELNQFTLYIVTMYVGSDDTKYETEKHEDCTIAYTSLGGDTKVNFPISVYFSNKITNGYVPAEKFNETDFEFVANA